MKNDKNYFRSLAPDNNAENVGSYAAWLHSVATDSSTNQDYGNIALTGDIGIGKSSIVRTYEKNKNYKFVYITAGDLGYRFEKDEITGLPLLPRKKSECSNDKNVEDEAVTSQNDDNGNQQEETEPPQDMTKDKPENSVELTDDDVEKLSEEIQQKLEKNLLEQLIALCSSKDIPKSRFQTVPENESTADKRFWQIIYPIFCVIAAFCGFKLIANNFIEQDFFDFVNFVPWTWLILIVFLSLSIGVAVSKLITHYKFTKITLNVGKEDNGGASAEIDIDEGENASLDTNLHEIIYLFEQLAKKKRLFKWRKPVFVIEDVDRYPAEICFPILTKFKQINDMLNSRYRLNHSGYGKHFKFIYTLNDKIFDDSQGGRSISDNDPYKFFDVIIPVIPKLSFANSYNELDEFFNVDNQYYIDPIFLQKISYYIFDFRKLRDIENEFVVYRNKFDNDLSSTALLAFVMYKIFYKSKYYELFKTDKNGVPQSKLLQKVLYGSKEIVTDGELEEILVSRFDAWLGTILNMSDFVKKSYLENMVTSGERKSWSGRDLSGLSLRYVILQNYDFMKCVLENVDFTGADLTNSILRDVDLTSIKYNEHTIWENAKYNFATKFPKEFNPRKYSMKLYLKEENLEGCMLKEKDMSEAILIKTNLHRADLEMTKLEKANLKETVLKAANLKGAILKEVYLFRTNFESAILEGAIIQPSFFNNINLKYANLKGANLENIKYDDETKWTEARYDLDTKLPKDFNPKDHGMILDLRGDNLRNMDLRGKDLSNALLQGAHLEHAHLEGANLKNANLKNANLKKANLEGANLFRANLEGAKLSGANLEGANLFGANLFGANLVGANLVVAKYNIFTIFPDGFNPEEHIMIKVD